MAVSSLASNRKIKKDSVQVFFITLVLKLLFLCQNVNYGINADRIGDLIASASMTGRDWSLIIPKVNYYGYGFKWIYSIFMAFTDNPYTIYYVIMLMYCFLMALIAVLVYHITTTYFSNVNGAFAKTIAVFMGLVGLVDMKSESSVYLATWIAAFILVKAVSETNQKAKNKLAVCMALFLSYSLTLHERMLAMILGFIFVYIIYRVKMKAWIFSPRIYAPIQIVSYIFVKALNNAYRIHFWGRADVGNSSAIPSNLTSRMYFFQSLDGFKVAIKCAWSNIATLITQTYGLAVVALMVFVVSFVLVSDRKGDERGYTASDRSQLALVWFGGISTAIVIAGLVVSWGGNAFCGDLYGLKGFVYGRYYVNFAFPAILGAICWCDTHEIKARYIVSTWVLAIVGILGFFKSVLPLLEYGFENYAPTESTSDTSLYWILYYKFDPNASIRENLIIDILVLFVVWGIFTARWLKVKSCKAGMALTTLLAVVAMSSGATITRPSVVFSGDVYGTVYDFFKDMEDMGVEFSSDILYTDSNAWPLQYMLNRYRVVYDMPQESADEVVFVSTNAPETEKEKLPEAEAYSYITIADNQYIYYKGDNNSAAVEAMGYQGERLIPDSETEAETATEAGDGQSTILSLNERKVQIPEADREYKIVIVNDLHIITPDVEIADEYKELVDSRYQDMQNENGIAPADAWDEMSKEINEMDADLVIFAGDMVDYASTANYDCLKQGMKNIDAPIMYLRSDHDYSLHYTDSWTQADVTAGQESLGENKAIETYDFGSFVVMGINNSWENLSDEAIADIETIVEAGKPIVVATHVPYDTYYDSSYRTTSLAMRGMYNMWGIGDRYTPDENTSTFMSMLYQDTSLFRAVVTGHLHYQSDTKLTENVSEFTFAPAYAGNVGILYVTP